MVNDDKQKTNKYTLMQKQFPKTQQNNQNKQRAPTDNKKTGTV